MKPAANAAGLIDQLRELEDLKSAIAGVQARIAVAVDVAERQAQADAGVPATEQGKGVSAQIALARRESPSRGSRLLGLARALVTEMPHTLAALHCGQLNEWRATLLVKETACLSSTDRAAVDEELAPDTGTFDGCGDKAIIAAVKAASYRRDPRSVVNRAARAVTERSVSIRPAPDTMAYLTALLPVKEAVSTYAALSPHADTTKAAGDPRSRGQVMADTLVERVTGVPGGVSRVELQLIMTDRSLLQGDSEPARIPGYGIIGSHWARTLLTMGKETTGGTTDVSTSDPGLSRTGQGPTPATDPAVELATGSAPARPAPTDADPAGNTATAVDPAHHAFDVWLRRLYTAPSTGELVAMDSTARLFTKAQRRFITARDDTCRTPYCDAPIRHFDHIVPWHRGGPTTITNGAGLCEACNHTKEHPGWTAQTIPGPRHRLKVTTPTGHTYHSTAPPLPGTGSGTSAGAGATIERAQVKALKQVRSRP
ncbi:HNH endonuclease [Arthrobacter sp. AET 35A]|uniref:HNH endonuclease n=1 Tax=Arthrobacter sp. AET 35A TaxID=2292643 RepID=UPI001CE33A90|nr:HNH endonuclease signature motif containing protein [Arthrobacter sp. AET 35A]